MSRHAGIILDNPLLVKHARSRLRGAQVTPWVVVVVVLCLFILWAGQAFGWLRSGVALSVMLGLEVIILVLAGSQQVASAVGGARESGVIDFHRVSPQPPSWLTLGFFLGAPVREYVLFAVTVPFAILLALMAPIGVLGLLRVWVALLLLTWVFHAVSLLASLLSKKPKGAGRGSLTGLLLLSIFLGQPLVGGLLYASNSLTVNATVRFFGVPVYWLLDLLLYAVPLLGYLLLASVRKMRSEKAHSYSKLEAIGGMCLLTVLGVGGIWGLEDAELLLLILIYVLVLGAIVLAVTVTPNQAEYIRGVRRALHAGRKSPAWWTEEGANRIVVFTLCAVMFLGVSLAMRGAPPQARDLLVSVNAPLVVAVFTVAYVGLGLQYFNLRGAKSGSSLFALFLFIVWLVPLFGGSIAAAAGVDKRLVETLLGASPVTGIALSGGIRNWSGTETGDLARLAALVVAIGLAFVFHSLLIGCQRKVEIAVHRAIGKTGPSGPFDYPAPELVPEIEKNPAAGSQRLSLGRARRRP